MKIRTLAAVVAMALGSAHAAGPYDGIYHLGGSQWFSVHQNGSQLVIGSFWQLPVLPDRPIDFYLGDGQVMRSVPRLDSWDLYGGVINGNVVTVEGENNYGACRAAYTLAFDASGANVTRHAMTQTALGSSRGIDCFLFYQRVVAAFGTTFRIVRIF